jgi:hypothetical protein
MSKSNKTLWAKQRKKRGFDNRELWNLDQTIIKFVLPRLKAFRKYNHGYPNELGNMDAWRTELKKMIKAFKIMKNQYGMPIPDNKAKAAEEGLQSFAKYFRFLWD